MPHAFDDLGLSPAELQRLMRQLALPASAPSDDFDLAPSPADQQARRQALEAAAALIVANNRRLTEQFRTLGLLGDIAHASPPSTAPIDGLMHD